MIVLILKGRRQWLSWSSSDSWPAFMNKSKFGCIKRSVAVLHYVTFTHDKERNADATLNSSVGA
jgi:hypothetical protein